MTKQEIKLRDKFAKDLKKRAKGFKDRYGDDYEDVIFGTATNMAKKKQEKRNTQMIIWRERLLLQESVSE